MSESGFPPAERHDGLLHRSAKDGSAHRSMFTDRIPATTFPFTAVGPRRPFPDFPYKHMVRGKSRGNFLFEMTARTAAGVYHDTVKNSSFLAGFENTLHHILAALNDLSAHFIAQVPRDGDC